MYCRGAPIPLPVHGRCPQCLVHHRAWYTSVVTVRGARSARHRRQTARGATSDNCGKWARPPPQGSRNTRFSDIFHFPGPKRILLWTAKSPFLVQKPPFLVQITRFGRPGPCLALSPLKSGKMAQNRGFGPSKRAPYPPKMTCFGPSFDRPRGARFGTRFSVRTILPLIQASPKVQNMIGIFVRPIPRWVQNWCCGWDFCQKNRGKSGCVTPGGPKTPILPLFRQNGSENPGKMPLRVSQLAKMSHFVVKWLFWPVLTGSRAFYRGFDVENPENPGFEHFSDVKTDRTPENEDF